MPFVVPTLPQLQVDTTLIPPPGPTQLVTDCSTIQTAINAAAANPSAGTVKILHTLDCTGAWTLPVHSGPNWVWIETDGTMPAPGTRVSSANYAQMPILRMSGTNSIVNVVPNAGYYRLMGIHFQSNLAANTFDQIRLTNMTSVADTPNHIIFDRDYFNGTGNSFAARRAFLMGGAYIGVINSVCTNFYEGGSDAQCIGQIDGPGPLLVENNFMEASGEVFITGGSPSISAALNPQDITFRRNFLFKPLSWCPTCGSWDGINRTIKNSFELKNSQRVLAECNVMVGNWASAQNGLSILFTPRATNSVTNDCPQCNDIDTTFRNNLIHDVEAGINVLGIDTPPNGFVQRLLVQNNLFYNIKNLGGGAGGKQGTANQVLIPNSGVYPIDTTFWHNTYIQTGAALGLGVGNGGITTFTYGNNLQADVTVGYSGDNFGVGNGTMNHYTPGTTYQKNILYGPFPTSGGETPSQYNNFCAPSGTCTAANTQTQMIFPANQAAVLFVNPGANNYALQAGSPYHNNGSDGADIGANVAAINACVAGVEVQP